MSDKECKDFLSWLSARLRTKYNEDKDILNCFNAIIAHKKLIDKSINPEFIVHMCERYYPGFFLEKSDDLGIGYLPSERIEIQSRMASIIADTILEQSK